MADENGRPARYVVLCTTDAGPWKFIGNFSELVHAEKAILDLSRQTHMEYVIRDEASGQTIVSSKHVN